MHLQSLFKGAEYKYVFSLETSHIMVVNESFLFVGPKMIVLFLSV